MAAAVVATISRGRAVDIAILCVYLLSLLVFGAYVRHNDGTNLHKLCVSTENIKSVQRQKARTLIARDLRFLREHPGGSDALPESFVRADVAANRAIIDGYPPHDCGD